MILDINQEHDWLAEMRQPDGGGPMESYKYYTTTDTPVENIIAQRALKC